MEGHLGQAAREYLLSVLMRDDTIAAQLSEKRAPDSLHEAESFIARWNVIGDDENGVTATVKEQDSIFELSILEREDGKPINVFHLAMTLDQDEVRVHSTSDADQERNFQRVFAQDGTNAEKTLMDLLTFIRDSVESFGAYV